MLPHALWGSNKRNTEERANISHATISFYTQKDSHALSRNNTCEYVLYGAPKKGNTEERANISHATIGFYTQKDSRALVRDITFPSVNNRMIMLKQ